MEDVSNFPASLAEEITHKMTGRAVPDFDGLASTCASHFRRLQEKEQAETVALIGIAACQLANGAVKVECQTCDNQSSAPSIVQNQEQINQLLDSLEALHSQMERSTTSRLAALEAYRRVLNHVQSSVRLDVTSSKGGRFALQMLRSATRDTRIRAALLLRTLVRGVWDDTFSTTRKNRIAVLEYLHTLWQSGRLVAQEAVVTTLFRIAEVVGDEELNIILLRLVEYLGHPNAYISGLVSAQFVQLAQVLQISMSSLFRPFWRTISIVVIKNLNSRPAIAQQLCDLLGMDITGLLQLIEEDVVPYLVLTGQTEVISRIAATSNSPLNAFELCAKPNTLPRVLAALLAEDYDDPEETIIKILDRISTDFGDRDLAAWLSIDHSKIACELLKLAGDTGHAKESKKLRGLQLLAQLAFRRAPGTSGGRRGDATPLFLENNAWEIVTIFTTVFDDSVTREMNVERRRCLTALGEIVKLGKGRVSFVIPSICACLRSAMADPATCDAAYTAWTAMILALEEEEVAELLEQTFAVTIKFWQTFSNDTKQRAHEALTRLFKKQKGAIKERAELLPSLSTIPRLAKFEEELQAVKAQKDEMNQLLSFVTRLNHETLVVAQLAMKELVDILRTNTDFIQLSLLREQPDTVFAELIRAILDCRVKFSHDSAIVLHAAECLGAIGRVDPSRVESIRDKPAMIVLWNFALATENTTFLMFFMEQIVVKEYLSASSLRSKAFIGWALQELLHLSELTPEIASRTRVGGLNGKDRQWLALSEETRLVLTPFLTSRFLAPGKRKTKPCSWPIFRTSMSYDVWLTQITLDLMTRALGQTVDLVFEVCWRMVHFSRGTAIASFLLPYASLNLLVNGTEGEKDDLLAEFLIVLQQPYHKLDNAAQDTIRSCSQSIFEVLDYLSKWLQEKRKWFSNAQLRAERGIRDPAMETALPQIQAVEAMLRSIPPNVITQRSIECKSFARALLHWEEYIHSKKDSIDDDYRRLQDIYAQIDEPDGIEGISSCMHVLNAESQILEHRKGGRWQAVQNWYEMQMTEEPDNVDVQINLLHALKESGQHDVLLHQFDGINTRSTNIDQRLLPYATEAAWATAQFDTLSSLINFGAEDQFNVRLASSMLQLSQCTSNQDYDPLEGLWRGSVKDLSYNSTSTIAASSDALLRTHVTEDLRLMAAALADTKSEVLEVLGKRLDSLGTDLTAKHFILNVQRAVMQLRSDVFVSNDISTSWLTTAKLARKARASNQAFDAVLRAASLGDDAVVIEQAKLMWLEGRQRKAIKTLESAIESGVFNAHTYVAEKNSMVSRSDNQEQNNTRARAYVLLGKWLDQAGQTQSEVIIKTFRKATEQNSRWERGWYYLGSHYNRILESERLKPPGKETQSFLAGEAAKVVISNFLRAISCGNKYLFQTLPKVLTLWLELVSNPEIGLDSRRGTSKFHDHLNSQRKKCIVDTNTYVKKYVDRMEPVALYTILPQLVARICHANQQVYEILQSMIARVVQSFPQQALWTLLAVTKSVDKTRAVRGMAVITKVVELQKKASKNVSATDLRTMISGAQRFTDELLRVADYTIEGKTSKISLAKDLGFNHKIAPSKLVVPVETCLLPNIPIVLDSNTKNFRAFSNEPVTISAFLDEALVLASLQKPRKMSIRGSDGHIYAILAKPKDDLRKDQRLMEFDTMINRFLKRDIDASKRKLYIRTYAVIPLNEECGVIEWVNSLKTMRDILLKLYRERNVMIDYGALRVTLDEICTRSVDKAKDFTHKVLPLFPPVLRYWFVETFPDPSAWLNARVRYTRSAAVMSMVGHILGLGDRHGENILFEEDNGGVMHVDFNCLFDKGLTFDKPECVPFRLTHNMSDAFGTFGNEGPFRRACEITMTLLRSHEDGLMTILETFLHDPTTDFQTAGKRRKNRDPDGLVPDTAEKMLEGVKGKVRGMLAGESVPLSVGGYVEEMIKQASDRGNLSKMYIGWCAFL